MIRNTDQASMGHEAFSVSASYRTVHSCYSYFRRFIIVNNIINYGFGLTHFSVQSFDSKNNADLLSEFITGLPGNTAIWQEIRLCDSVNKR